MAVAQIMGHKIPKGTNVYAFIQALHLNPQEWKESEKFIPERFSNYKSQANWNYIPFAAGPRSCIGEKYANQGVLVALAMIAQSFDVIGDETRQVYPKVGITTEAENFFAKFVPRK